MLRQVAFYLLLASIFFAPFTPYPVAIFILTCFIIVIINLPKKILTLNLLDKLQLIYTLWLIPVSCFAVYKGHSFLASLVFVLYLFAYLSARSLFDSHKFNLIIKILIITCLFLDFWSILQSVGLSIKWHNFWILRPRKFPLPLTSLCFNQRHFAVFLEFILPIFLALWFFTKNKYLLILFIVNFLFLILTHERGPFGSTIVAILVLAGLFKRYKFGITIIIVLVLIGLSFRPFRKRLLHTFEQNADIARKVNIIGGLKMWRDHNIVTGIGVNNYPLLYKQPKYYDKRVRILPFVHNLYISMLVETGIIGLILSTILFITFMRWLFYLFKTSKDILKFFYGGLFAAFIGTFVDNLFDCTPYIIGFGTIYWIFMGIISCEYSRQVQNE